MHDRQYIEDSYMDRVGSTIGFNPKMKQVTIKPNGLIHYKGKVISYKEFEQITGESPESLRDVWLSQYGKRMLSELTQAISKSVLNGED